MSDAPKIESLTIIRPDDFHVHFRDGGVLRAVVPSTARDFARAIVMPNLIPPVVTGEQASAYKARILDCVPEGSFQPLMTLYLTETTQPENVRQAIDNKLIHAIKLYPAGATTNSDSGVHCVERVIPVLEVLAETGTPLCVHGEVTDPDIDIFDREAAFIDKVLLPLRERLPELRIVMEHITTRDGVDFVKSQDDNVAATITPHHLMLNRNHLLAGGIRPHYYCLPIVKRESHRQALRVAATSGDSRFFLGTDSAPHTRDTKESACGCAGVFNAPNTMGCLAQVFEEEQALDKLEMFSSLAGSKFYRLPANDSRITLRRFAEPVKFPAMLATATTSSPAGLDGFDQVTGPDSSIVVFDPAQPVYWDVVRD